MTTTENVQAGSWWRLRRPRSGSQPRVIALFGLFGAGNLGNDASLSSAIAAVRRIDPNSDVVCVCGDPGAVRDTLGVDAVPIMMTGKLSERPRGPRLVRLAQLPVFELARWISVFGFLRRVSLVVLPGTGALDDLGQRPKDMPYQLFRWVLAARLARKPFAFVGVGAGPIKHPVSRFLMKYAVKFSTYFSYRDEASRSYMAGIGASTMNAVVVPDLVFALPCPSEDAKSARTTIGLGVMFYRGWNDPHGGEDIFRRYIENLSAIASRIHERGDSIRILIGDRDDEQAVDALLEDLRIRRGIDCDSDRVIVEPIASIDDVLTQIASTDAVIATRFHNVVGALMMGRPVISLGYGAKFIDVMSSVGLAGYCHDVESFSPDAVLNDLDELHGGWQEFAPLVEVGIKRMREELVREFNGVIGGAASGLAIEALGSAPKTTDP